VLDSNRDRRIEASIQLKLLAFQFFHLLTPPSTLKNSK